MARAERNRQAVFMLGTDPAGSGGVAAVISGYQRAGLQQRWPIRYLATHHGGASTSKVHLFLVTLFRYLRALVAGEVGLVHVHTASRVSFYRKSVFLLLAYLARVPAIIHIHGAQFHRFYGQECGALGRAYVRFIIRRAHRLIVLSSYWNKFFSVLVEPRKVVTIHNAVLPPSAPSSRTWDSDPKCVLFLGRIGQRKGFFDLLQVVAHLRDEGWNPAVWAGGDGDLDGAAAKARELGIDDRVHFLGWIGGEAKAETLRRAYCFCLPSYAEGLPMALLDAMGAGLPVITTPVGGIPEVVTDGVEGYLVEPGDLGALEAAIARLLADEKSRDRMGRAARRKIDTTFSLDAVLPLLEAVYRELGVRPLVAAASARNTPKASIPK